MADVNWGGLRRTLPIARRFGFERGRPVDRYYIERFLERHSLAIRGRVLEFGDSAYTRRFGGARVEASEVWQWPDDRNATIVADLANADHLPSATFDCIICTQTLQFVFDVRTAVRTLHRLLKPRGVLLATLPGISQIDDPTWAESWCWSFTVTSARRLFTDAFAGGRVEVESQGNVLASIAFLHGLSASELAERELRAEDPMYPLLVTAIAVKAAEESVRESPLVSVIIPCFNQANFLGQAIESALDQTTPPHEIIVVDDGSPDNVAEVAARYRAVTCVRQTNQGLSAARNTGLRHALGTYVVFVDADDRLLPQALADGIAHLEARPECAFVSGHHRFIDISGAVTGESTRPPVTGDRYALLLRQNYISMGAAVMYRREVFDRVGEFDTTLLAAEDYDLYLRIARQFPVCDHERVVAEYRRHGSAITDEPLRMLTSVLRVLRAQEPFVRDFEPYRLAYEDGLRYWRAYYGSRTADWIAGQPADERRRRAIVRQVLLFAVTAPLEAARLLQTVLRLRLQSRA